jgi:hypothetical protein
MRMIFASALALIAAACSPTAEGPATISQVNGCAASASGNWRPLSGVDFTVEATTSGADCATARATLVVRDVQGNEVLRENGETAHIMTLASAQDVVAMNAALAEWVAFENTTMATTSALPEWPAGAPQPPNGEFPFYQEESVTREAYNALRQRNVPLFCYIQGMESLGCFALENGRLTKVGAQSFPG